MLDKLDRYARRDLEREASPPGECDIYKLSDAELAAVRANTAENDPKDSNGFKIKPPFRLIRKDRA